MKKRMLILLILLGFGLTKAQFFEEDTEYTQENKSSGFFEQSSPFEHHGEDSWGDDSGFPTGPGNDPVPIDDYIFLLPLLGIAVGGYYLIRTKKEFNV